MRRIKERRKVGKARVTGDETAIWVEFERENAREGSVGGRSKIIEERKMRYCREVPTLPLPGYLDLTCSTVPGYNAVGTRSTTVAGMGYVP